MTLVKWSYEFLKIFVSSNPKLKKILNLRSLVKRGPDPLYIHRHSDQQTTMGCKMIALKRTGTDRTMARFHIRFLFFSIP